MKRTLLLGGLVVTLIGYALVSTAASTPDLSGYWNIDSECVRVGDYPALGAPGIDFTTETDYVLLHHTPGSNLFWGEVQNITCDPSRPGCEALFGAIVGNDVYIASWDSFQQGRLTKGGREIDFVGRSQLYNPDFAPSACVGVAVKE